MQSLMKLYIAGGIWEHGRNCFALMENDELILIDCGIGTGTHIYPLLNDAQIKHAKYLFITHCHTDHIGAYSWLKGNGFNGTVICTSFTWKELSANDEPHILIDLPVETDRTINLTKDLTAAWGRSGHCAGSVWYFIQWHNKSILFTGDYCETSFSYPCNPLRGIHADLAVVDCAYGNRPYEKISTGFAFIDLIKKLRKKHSYILLPVPLYGRGLELCSLLQYLMKKVPVYASRELINEWAEENRSSFWTFQTMNIDKIHPLDTEEMKRGVIFIADAQLKNYKSFSLLLKIMKNDGCILMTGHIDPDTPADLIQKEKQVMTILYPIHLNIFSSHLLYLQNDFDQVVLFHCEEEIINPENEEWFCVPEPGSTILF